MGRDRREEQDDPAPGDGGLREGGEPHRIPVEDRIDLHAFAPRDIPGVVASYLEEASRRGYSVVRIVHGKGTGAQRKAVRDVLSRHPLVSGWADAPPEAGGWGATVARLRPPTSGR